MTDQDELERIVCDAGGGGVRGLRQKHQELFAYRSLSEEQQQKGCRTLRMISLSMNGGVMQDLL